MFAGYGISAPDLDHDDYRAADLVKGSIVLVVDHEPGERDPNSPFDGVVTSDAGGALRKAQAAQAKGAVGILYVADVHNHPGAAPGTGRELLAAAAVASRDVLAGGVDGKHQDSRGADFPGNCGPARQGYRPHARRSLEVGGHSTRRHGCPSAGRRSPHLDGRQSRSPFPIATSSPRSTAPIPALKDEWVIVSAHFDHDGANGTAIMNGADDDGSGTVGLLEIAEAYALAAKAGQRPRRSILFAAFNSEERGLLGAWAYTLQPTVPLDKIVAVLNMDMIGRNEEVPPPDPAAAGRGGGGGRFNGLDPQTAESNNNAMNIIGSVRSPDLKAQVEAANETANKASRLEIRYRYDNNVSQLMRRSDQWPFIQNGVPGIWIFTGLHPDYHTVNDDPDRINYVKMEKILRLVYQMSWTIAQQDARPKLLPRVKTQ